MSCGTCGIPQEANQKVENSGHPDTVTLSDKAVAKIREFAGSSQEANGKSFRVYIQGGGCSGFQYGFAFDDKQSDDHIITAGDIEVVVDPMSFPYLKGATVDFIEALSGAGFTVTNPNATSTCGCGTSFNV